jgi:hypothetical protein
MCYICKLVAQRQALAVVLPKRLLIASKRLRVPVSGVLGTALTFAQGRKSPHVVQRWDLGHKLI